MLTITAQGWVLTLHRYAEQLRRNPSKNHRKWSDACFGNPALLQEWWIWARLFPDGLSSGYLPWSFVLMVSVAFECL